jgi:hypothetical protein
LTAFALTPFVAGAYMMALSLLPGGSNPVLVIAPVWLFAAFTAWRFRRRLAAWARRAVAYVRRSPTLPALGVAAAVVGAFLGAMQRYGGHDWALAAVSLVMGLALALSWRRPGPAKSPLGRPVRGRGSQPDGVGPAGPAGPRPTPDCQTGSVTTHAGADDDGDGTGQEGGRNAGGRPPRRTWADWALITGGLLATAQVAQLLVVQVYRSISVALDGQQYLSEAKYFLEHFGPAGWATLEASPDGSVVGTTHNFTWSAYLALSLEHTSGPLGFANVAATHAAFGFSAVCLLAAVFAVGIALRNWRAGVAGVLMTLALPAFACILTSFSRDGYRMAGLLACLLLVWGAAEAARRDGLPSRAARDGPASAPTGPAGPAAPAGPAPRAGLRFAGRAALAALGGVAAMAAHPMNALAGFALAAGFVAWAFAARWAGWRFWALGAAAGLGAALGMAGPIWSALTGGALEGDYVSTGTVLAGTPYEANYEASRTGAVAAWPTLWDRFWNLLAGQPGWLVVIGACAALAACVLAFRRRVPRLVRANTLLLAVPLLATLATVNDKISWYGQPMSHWYVLNLRYPFHPAMFAVLAIMGLAALARCLAAVNAQSGPGAPSRRRAGPAAVTWGLVAAAGLVFLAGEPGSTESARVMFKVKPQAYSVETPGVLLLDNIHSAWLADGPALSLFSPQARDILLAQTVPELEAALDRHGVTAILSWGTYRLSYGPGAPLGEYLADLRNFRGEPQIYPNARYPYYTLFQRR